MTTWGNFLDQQHAPHPTSAPHFRKTCTQKNCLRWQFSNNNAPPLPRAQLGRIEIEIVTRGNQRWRGTFGLRNLSFWNFYCLGLSVYLSRFRACDTLFRRLAVIIKDETLFLLYIRFTQRDLAGVRVGLRMLFELCVCYAEGLGSVNWRPVCPPTIPVILLLPQTNAVVARNLDKKV